MSVAASCAATVVANTAAQTPASAAGCLDFGRPINERGDFNSDLEKVRDRWLLENRSGLRTRTYGRPARLQRSEQDLSAPADSINRAATIHRCSRTYSNTTGTDARGHHGSRDRPRPQHDAGPYDTPHGIRNVLAVHYGAGLFGACGHEPSYQQRRQRDRKLHFGLLHSEPLNGPIERNALDARVSH